MTPEDPCSGHVEGTDNKCSINVLPYRPDRSSAACGHQGRLVMSSWRGVMTAPACTYLSVDAFWRRTSCVRWRPLTAAEAAGACTQELRKEGTGKGHF
jgi:hypothetical protein